MSEEIGDESRLYQENHALNCLEIEELRRICHAARLLRTDELHAQTERRTFHDESARVFKSGLCKTRGWFGKTDRWFFTLHCPSGSTSSSSHSSMFPAALITSCDSLLKGLNARCRWRSLWSACRWGWFSIFWIKLWTLMPCDRFTIAFGTPEMLKSMFSSSVARLNLFALDDAVSRCSAGTNSFTVCVCLRLISQVPLFHREHAWRECLQTSQVSLFYLKNQVLLANVYHRSLVNGTFFPFPQNHVLCPQVSPFDHRLDWVWIGLVWKA